VSIDYDSIMKGETFPLSGLSDPLYVEATLVSPNGSFDKSWRKEEGLSLEQLEGLLQAGFSSSHSTGSGGSSGSLVGSGSSEIEEDVSDDNLRLILSITNREEKTYNDLLVELSVRGDLKIYERPQPLTLGPFDTKTLVYNIKIASTEASFIFSTLSFTNTMTALKHFLPLNEIKLNVMNHIRPYPLTDQEFRQKWVEFEWENRLAIQTIFPSPSVLLSTSAASFLSQIAASCHMHILHAHVAEGSESLFLTANLSAKSIFKEFALMNISIEITHPTTKNSSNSSNNSSALVSSNSSQESTLSTSRHACQLQGVVRIRAKTQGIALSLGDRVTELQRNG
jgi:coatomer subunit beta